MTTAELVTRVYVNRALVLQRMARDFEAMGDQDRADEARLGALMAYGAGRAEARHPDNPPMTCGICHGVRVCDITLHLNRARLGL